MEEIKAPECRPFHWCYDEALTICFGVYAERNSDEVCQEKPERGSGWSRESFLWNDCLTDNVIFPSYWMWQKVSTTFTQTIQYTET